MRTRRFFLGSGSLISAAVVLSSIFTGCGGSSSGTNSSGSGGSNTNGEFLYITSPNNIFAFTINSTTGTLSSPSSVSLPAQNASVSATVGDASAKLLFYFDAPDNAVAIFSINATNGSLTPDGSPVPVPTGSLGPGIGLGGLAIDPAGKFLFLADPLGSTFPNLYGIGTFAINGTTGSLTTVSGSLSSTGALTSAGGPISLPAGNPPRQMIVVKLP